MGINALLPVLKPICFERHVSQFRGKRAGIDGYGWLHKGAAGCALELCVGGDSACARARSTRRYVDFFMHRVRMLRHYGVSPVVVFDGARLPAKSATEQSRAANRQKFRELGLREMQRGNRAAAEEHFQKAVDVTPHMAHEVIGELRRDGVDYLVAPFEADAQLAYMSMRGMLDVVITEDSDLVVYGARRILFKMDRYGGGELLEYKNLGAVNDPNLSAFTPDMLRWMCVLAGCDFFAGVAGVGIRKAHQLVHRWRRLDRLLFVLRTNSKHRTPEDFEEQFRRAVLVFRCHRVYCPEQRELVHLHPLPEDAAPADVEAALGEHMEPARVRAIAEARVCPVSGELFEGARAASAAAVENPCGVRRAAPAAPAKRSLARAGGAAYWESVREARDARIAKRKHGSPQRAATGRASVAYYFRAKSDGSHASGASLPAFKHPRCNDEQEEEQEGDGEVERRGSRENDAQRYGHEHADGSELGDAAADRLRAAADAPQQRVVSRFWAPPPPQAPAQRQALADVQQVSGAAAAPSLASGSPAKVIAAATPPSTHKKAAPGARAIAIAHSRGHGGGGDEDGDGDGEGDCRSDYRVQRASSAAPRRDGAGEVAGLDDAGIYEDACDDAVQCSLDN